jgi:hypothetical protein
MKAFAKILIITIMIISSVLSSCYFFSARIYGDFTCILLSEKNQNVTENYEIYGISFFGNKYTLMQDNGIATNYPNAFCQILRFEHKKGEPAKSVLFYKQKASACKIIAYRTEINEIKVSTETIFLEKVKTNPLLLIALIISLISLLLGIVLFIKFYINNNQTKKILYWIFSPAPAILSGIIIFLTYYKTDYTPHTLNQEQTTKLNPNSQNIICISDTIGRPFEFTFTLDDKFWSNKESLMDYISNIEVKDTFNTSKFIIQAWRFVSENTFHCHQEYAESSLENFDSYLINSIGHGLCGEQTKLFCDIVEDKGYKARIFNNPGLHTFPEVFDKKWKMMDVSYGICFCNNNSEILSAEEINQRCEHRFIYANDKMSFFSNSKALFLDTKIFSSNTRQQEYSKSELNFSTFMLPANSQIMMPLYDSVLMEYTAKIIIPTASEQIIRIPLIITDYNADIFINLPSFEYIVSGQNIEITALLNPMLFLNATDLTVCSNNSLKIKVQKHQDSSDIYYVINNFTNDNYDAIRTLYNSRNSLNPLDYEDIYPIEARLLDKYKNKILWDTYISPYLK